MSHIYQNRNMHISVLNGALWDMEQAHSGICEIGQFPGAPVYCHGLTLSSNLFAVGGVGEVGGCANLCHLPLAAVGTVPWWQPCKQRRRRIGNSRTLSQSSKTRWTLAEQPGVVEQGCRNAIPAMPAISPGAKQNGITDAYFKAGKKKGSTGWINIMHA